MSAYSDFVFALAAEKPAAAYSAYLYGSVLWGDRTCLESGAPVSDIDLLVVGQSLDDLRIAAGRMAKLFSPFQDPGAPFFKLGIKLRRRSEVREELLSANEGAALLRGKLLAGPEVPAPDFSPEWYRRQADLVVPTRLQCNVTQRQRLAYATDPIALHRYLAARTILDIPAVIMSSRDDLGGSYSERLARFDCKVRALRVGAIEKRALRLHLLAALRTKRAPERHDCGALDAAEELLVRFAARCGVRADNGDSKFWESQRPLDVRDWQLRQSAG